MTTVPPSLHRAGDHFAGRFKAMASPCELLVATNDEPLARRLTLIAQREAHRIEAKFSRYRADNIIHRINTSSGEPIEVDSETANLLDYADHCYRLSEGRFDITTGVLRRVWTFDGSDRLPEPTAVQAVLNDVGWQKITWARPHITLPQGMEIDLGGIGKEYAVDSAAQLIRQHTDVGFVVNFGGDLYIGGPRADGTPWQVGVEDPRQNELTTRHLALARGALATSGDARRYLLKDGVRYSHILDPRTGWPIPDAPRSITVLASTCLEAGTLSTLAMLQGASARSFLESQEVRFWIT